MKTVKLTLKELDEIIENEMESILLREQRNKHKITVKTMNGEVIDYDDTETARLFRAQEERKKAIEGFQSYYRTLNHNQAFELRKWLKSKLLNELNLKEIEEITSRVVASSDGLRQRKDPLSKPK